MRCLLPTTVAVILAALMQSDVRGQESNAPPPEMKVLHRLLGTWKVEQMTSVPETGSVTHIVKRELVLGGRFVREIGGFDDGEPDYTAMLTYDSQRKTYRNWFFHDSGFYWEASGTWDETSQTLTFTYGLPGNGKGILTFRFMDETTLTFSMIGKDPRGEVVYRSEGEAVRHK